MEFGLLMCQMGHPAYLADKKMKNLASLRLCVEFFGFKFGIADMNNRILTWGNCNNVRDLGGLRIIAGGQTRFGTAMRGDTPTRLTAVGWQALYDYGARAILTLGMYGMDEPELSVTSPYPDVAVVRAEIEDVTDQEFVERWVNTSFWGTPLYFKDALRRWPERHAAVISAIARAKPGGVLFHCGRGYDRTGVISLLVLTLAGVALDEIVADYELSVDSLRDKLLAKENSSVEQAMREALAGLGIESYLLAGGASLGGLAAIRQRFLETN